MVAEGFIPIEARSGHRLVSVLVMKIFTNKRHLHLQMVCGFVLLRLNVPVNIFSVMSGRSHRFQGITSTFSGSKCIFAQGHNTAEVGIEPPISRIGVRGSTTNSQMDIEALRHRVLMALKPSTR